MALPIRELEKERVAVKRAVLAGRALGRAVGLMAFRERAIDAIVSGSRGVCSGGRLDGGREGCGGTMELCRHKLRLKLEMLSQRGHVGVSTGWSRA